MTAQKTADFGLATFAKRFSSRESDAQAIVREALSRAHQHAGLNAFAELDETAILASAAQVDANRLSGSPYAPLEGVPIAIPDNLCTTDGRTRAASRIMADYRSPFDATAVTRLRAAGVIPFGKTNVDEFGVGHTGESSIFGPTRHPLDAERSPGGASSGAAAAVAAQIVPAALAVDTTGSLLQPAAYTGLVGLRPTYGAVSRVGVYAVGSSFDSLGVLATNAVDAASVYCVIAAEDPDDGTSRPAKKGDLPAIEDGVKGMRIGLLKNAMDESLSDETRAAILAVRDELVAAGAEVVEVEIPLFEHAAQTAYLLVTAELSSNLTRFDGMRFGYRAPDATTVDEIYAFSRTDGFGPEIRQRAVMGTLFLSEERYQSHYVHAQKVRRKIADAYAQTLASLDALLSPVNAGVAPKLGLAKNDPVANAKLDRYTAGAALASLPAAAFPAGTSAQGLPIGAQLIGGECQELKLLRIVRALEMARTAATTKGGQA